MIRLLSGALILFIIGLSCKNDSTSSGSSAQAIQDSPVTSASRTISVSRAKILSPTTDTTLRLTQPIVFSIVYDESNPIKASATVNGNAIPIESNEEFTVLTLPTQQGAIGANTVQLKFIYPDSAVETLIFPIKLLSDISPIVQRYKVLNEYPHNDESFTQGLIYEAGKVCEGSGLQGKSVIYCYELNTGTVIKEAYMPPEYFGEGITRYNDVMYQLTYKSQKIVLYNPDNLNKMGERYWPTEGWGITHNDQQLIVSDGSNQLYFVDPTSLNEIRRIEVADDNRFYDRLNELEYIEGVVYANVWLTDSIIGINPQNGKVLSVINMKNILPGYNSSEQEDHVLNGIAYIPERKSWLITGKQWPKMFEIAVTPSASPQ